MSLTIWQFSTRFRKHAFGWRSQVPIQRIKEALTEIRKVARTDPILAAQGAVLFLEKISPSLEHVDSSSGAIGSTVNHAITTLVPIISQAIVSTKERQSWLERLWKALQNDNMPYIEYLGDFWGELCVTPEIAFYWSDQLIETVIMAWTDKETGHGFFKGTTACLSALLSAQRYQELLTLLEKAPFKWWYDRHWGVKALVALGKLEETLQYAENSKGLNEPRAEIAKTCEDILLSLELVEEAYKTYALEAHQCMTHLNTFRAIAKKYPDKSALVILQDLIKSQPGSEGKWFATAKTAQFFDLAIELISHHPADPKTLTRAAKDFSEKNPPFAIASGMASLHWIIEGYGYEISNMDIITAYSAILKATEISGQSIATMKTKIDELLSGEKPNTQLVKKALMPYLKEGEL